MDLPEFIDTEIISSVGYWIITLGTMIALLIGFKLSASFGVVGSEVEYEIPIFIKLSLFLLTPVISYLVSMKVFR